MEPPRSSGNNTSGIDRDSRPSTSETQPHSESAALWSPVDGQHSPFDNWHHPDYANQTAYPTDNLVSSPSVLMSPSHIQSDRLRFGSSFHGIEADSSNTNYLEDDNKARSLSGIYLEKSVWPLSSKEEAELLRYFVERLARDFDLTDPERHFREVVPRRAATCPVLLNAIYALSARHLSRVAGYDPLVSDKYHSECLKR